MGSIEVDSQDQGISVGKRWLARAGLALLVFAIGGLAIVWNSRERIAGNLIDDYLAQTGLRASYEIEQIGPQSQILTNVVVGDPAEPDLTIERVSVGIAYGFGAPEIGSAVLEKPRLYGSYQDGNVSFGALDAVLFASSDSSAGLPAIDVSVKDGGALFESDFGDVGLHLDGEGPLNDGFKGTLALVAPGLRVEGCSARKVTAYGELSIESGAPQFSGPLRLRDMQCSDVSLATADIGAVLALDDQFTKAEGELNIEAGALLAEQGEVDAVNGVTRFSVDAQSLVLDHDLGLSGVKSDFASVSILQADGTLRSGAGFTQSSWDAQFEGEGVALDEGSSAAIRRASTASADSLLGPLLDKLERNFTRTTKDASLSGSVAWRKEPDAQSLIIPEAYLRSDEGETLLAMSRFNWSMMADGNARIAANFLTGGSGLPQINGRMEQDAGGGPGGGLVLRMAMQPYREGENEIAVPSLSIRQGRANDFVFAGIAQVTGDIPGGSIKALKLPINGRFAAQSGLRLGTSCTDVTFDELNVYGASLGAHSIELCPSERRAMIEYRDMLDIGIATQSLELNGAIGTTPSHIAAAGATLRYPGGFELQELSARIGQSNSAVHLNAASLSGEVGDVIGGTFNQASAMLDVVPLDITQMAGSWAYGDNVLKVSDASFTLTERTDAEARFEPLIAQGATLSLVDGEIAASADLRHRDTGSDIASIAVRHRLSDGVGSALLNVDQLTFGPSFGVDDLTYLAQGVIAYADGSISGGGRIDWTSEDITSSGAFRSEGFNLAAAFGPVEGLRGEVRFSDLINLTTEPSQEITIGSINPGIAAFNGKVRFSLTNGEIIEVEDARWPFMDGTLIMRPTTLRYGSDAEQRYVFEIIGLDAAKFVAQMELTNLGASGKFDGTVPIIFDAQGNGRIEGGVLISRQPGGNVSYIGELSYEDLGAIGNYAFEALRSLDYTQMGVGLDGDLAGEIITRFSIDGVRQGDDASKDFITRRLAKLPVRFDVNVRSENFYELATMVRTFWDPDALPDPVDQGVLSSDGTLRITPTIPVPIEAPAPETDESDINAVRPDEPGVQPLESETVP